MTRLGGIKLSEFNALVKQFKGIYPFKDEDATIVSINSPDMGNEPCRLEIFTKDEATGINLVMSKGVERDTERMW